MLTDFLAASSSFYFVNNYINFNVNSTLYLNDGANYFKNIVALSTATALSSTQAQNYYICNNTIESTYCTNAFDSSTTSIMTVQSTIFSSNTGIVSIYYQLNTHLASQNYIFEKRIKDFPDIYIDILNSNKTNVSIYFIDLYANEFSNFLKLIVNYKSKPIPSLRTSTTPFLYYAIQ